uniref:Reverse transcriptase Ty1/copia-type domain-containing protein n=1 Tax=Fagus sylvatica TaxID=28930 RepID=A0A2N9EPH4_FAGSY
MLKKPRARAKLCTNEGGRAAFIDGAARLARVHHALRGMVPREFVQLPRGSLILHATPPPNPSRFLCAYPFLTQFSRAVLGVFRCSKYVMQHIVGKLLMSTFQWYKFCANLSSDERVMTPGSQGAGAVFACFSGEDSGQTGEATGEPRVARRSWSHHLSNVPGLAGQLAASRKDSVREGGCPGEKCAKLSGIFPAKIPARPGKILAIREFHTVHECVLFPTTALFRRPVFMRVVDVASDVGFRRSWRRWKACATYFLKVQALHRGELGFARYDPANRGHWSVPYAELFSLLPMPSIVFQVQPFLIRLLMSAFLDLHLTINISDHLALPVSSFFRLMNTTNSSLVLAFVASLVMVKLKKDIDVMILLLIAFASPVMLSFGSIVYSLRYLNFVPLSLSPLSQIFFQRCLLLLQNCFLPLRKCLPPFRRLSHLTTLLDHPLTRRLILRLNPQIHCYTALATLHKPHSYREASTNPLWQVAMTKELDALFGNRTWDLIDLPPNKSVVGCKWVFKIKTRSDGSIERYKARLVAKGFTQEYGIDYEETFAPVACLSSVRTLLAVAASQVYMQPPSGLSHPPDKVCRLRRALYGLKQAPRAWFAKFSSTVSRLGFSISSYDSAFFLRRTGKELKDFLSQNFEMKDLGHLSYFLGLEITSSNDRFYLTQAKYTTDLLSQAELTDHKIVDTPIELNVRLTPSSGELLPDPTLYRETRNNLLWLTLVQRLNIVPLLIPHLNSSGCDGVLVQIARNDVFHERTKHIEIDCHLVRHHLLQGSLKLFSVSFHNQLADIFTKSHPTGRFRDLVSKLQLVSHPPP